MSILRTWEEHDSIHSFERKSHARVDPRDFASGHKAVADLQPATKCLVTNGWGRPRQGVSTGRRIPKAQGFRSWLKIKADQMSDVFKQLSLRADVCMNQCLGILPVSLIALELLCEAAEQDPGEATSHAWEPTETAISGVLGLRSSAESAGSGFGLKSLRLRGPAHPL